MVEEAVLMDNVKLSEITIDPEVIVKIPVNLVHRHNIIPLYEENGAIKVAVSDPLAIHALDDIGLITGREVKPVLAEKEEIKKAIKHYYGLGAETMEEIVKGVPPVEILKEEAQENLEEMTSDPSIVKFVNQVILDAHKSRATDIHLEPFEGEIRIRYRIDGFLHEVPTPEIIRHFQLAIISRLKNYGRDEHCRETPSPGRSS